MWQIIQCRANTPLTLVTMTGIALLTIIPFGVALEFMALPASYFAYLIPCILIYILLATSLNKAYVLHYGELLYKVEFMVNINWQAIWMRLFGTKEWFGLIMGFWVRYGCNDFNCDTHECEIPVHEVVR